MDDVSSDETSEDEATLERATQRLRRKGEKRMDNQPAESGIIESITCTNFMCHSKLHIPLGPLINFIIGHNGSGKSAVLTALTLCLGGKATATNRGQNLKSFVKEGQEYVYCGRLRLVLITTGRQRYLSKSRIKVNLRTTQRSTENPSS